MWFKKMFRLD